MTATRSIEDWEVPERLQVGLGGPLGVPLGAVLLLGVAIAIVAAPIAGIAVDLVLGGGYLLWAATRGRAALQAVGAGPVSGEDEPRAANLLAGKADDMGTTTPSLWVIPSAGANAMVSWSRGPHVALTRGALDALALSELEAVITHCLVRHATGESKRATMALALGPLGASFTRVGAALDVRAAASTRYPPGLAAAIRKCEPQEGQLAALWFVAQGPTHAGQEDRAESLLDL